MANALAIFEQGAIPAHIATMNEEASNITSRSNFNALTFEGKVWQTNVDGKKTKLMRTNAEGEEEPVPIVNTVVIAYNPDRGREFYAKAYDPKNPTIPDCWSEDSKTPHANVPSPCAKTCAVCPNSKKGSAQTADGKGTTACGQFQKLVVTPTSSIEARVPLRLRIKITSIYDASGQDKHPNWFAWQQYLDLLVSKGVRHTALLPTKIKFDPLVAYPKLLFSPGKDWLDPDSLEIIKEMAASDAVKDLLSSTYDPETAKTGNKPLPAEEEEEEAPAAAQPAQTRVVAATGTGKSLKAAQAELAAKQAAAAPEADEDEEEEEDSAAKAAAAVRAQKAAEQAAAAQAAAQKAAAKAAVTKQASVAADDGEEEEETAVPPPKTAKTNGAAAPGKGKATPAGKAATGPVNAPPEVADMLGDWDD